MNRKEARAQIAQMLDGGSRKATVFDSLSGRGVADKRLAWMIASHVDPQRAADNRFHAWVLVGVMFLQLVFGLFAMMGVWRHTSIVAGLIVLVLMLAWSGLFMYGFLVNRAGTYTAVLMLTVVSAFQRLKGGAHGVQGVSGVHVVHAAHPGMTLFGWLLSFALFGYVLFVRRRLFPDFAWIGPRKQGGQYVFVD
ncbi:hypothetical protein [Burkholderia sp. Ac-20379]|uniref:hypothetical protein n=1 Tax=Burkholderia sp. Ac-20379 TaxID=2703900 RepID=UPI00198223EE|nr:hypothetical protein [Burkholderia sp. Ac-20379]MBN3726212.1 hypothetical protein [Burkholderia sp. Ac-20379]